MNHSSSTRDLDELDLVDFPRSAAWCDVCWGRCGKCVHAFFRSRVIDVPEIDQRAGDIEAGFFARFAACRLFQTLIWIRRAFRDPPRRAPVVVPRWVNEKHLDRSL